jgi:molybdenum cofactor biosynthesis enzyme MoaA
MTEVLLEITKKCKEQCPYCSTDSSPDGDHKPFGDIVRELDSVENIRTINISGGEPLYHPQIGEIIDHCLSITEDVWIYTNLIKQLRFNSDIVKEVKVHANVCVVPGESVYIPENVDQVHLLKLKHTGRGKDLPETKITVSHNFETDSTHDCENCKNIVFQADGKVVESPCKKNYG